VEAAVVVRLKIVLVRELRVRATTVAQVTVTLVVTLLAAEVAARAE
jgi:hypothetical protein